MAETQEAYSVQRYDATGQLIDSRLEYRTVSAEELAKRALIARWQNARDQLAAAQTTIESNLTQATALPATATAAQLTAGVKLLATGQVEYSRACNDMLQVLSDAIVFIVGELEEEAG